MKTVRNLLSADTWKALDLQRDEAGQAHLGSVQIAGLRQLIRFLPLPPVQPSILSPAYPFNLLSFPPTAIPFSPPLLQSSPRSARMKRHRC